MDEFIAVVRARELVRQAGIAGIPVGMDHYLKVAKATCRVRDDFPDDVSGNTTLIAGRHCIFVNGRHSPERQRFTILHEIAHIILELPSIHESLITSATLMSYAKRPQEEVCCDAFAAECLLPYGFFKKDVDRQDVGLASVEKLASDYQASLTCIGSRFSLVNDALCAFVLAESGIVRYVSYLTFAQKQGGSKLGKLVPKWHTAWDWKALRREVCHHDNAVGSIDDETSHIVCSVSGLGIRLAPIGFLRPVA